jgi:hypothetical protein
VADTRKPGCPAQFLDDGEVDRPGGLGSFVEIRPERVLRDHLGRQPGRGDHRGGARLPVHRGQLADQVTGDADGEQDRLAGGRVTDDLDASVEQHESVGVSRSFEDEAVPRGKDPADARREQHPAIRRAQRVQ